MNVNIEKMSWAAVEASVNCKIIVIFFKQVLLLEKSDNDHIVICFMIFIGECLIWKVLCVVVGKKVNLNLWKGVIILENFAICW